MILKQVWVCNLTVVLLRYHFFSDFKFSAAHKNLKSQDLQDIRRTVWYFERENKRKIDIELLSKDKK